MESALRERKILDSLLENGAISVAGLSRDLEVSEVTIRLSVMSSKISLSHFFLLLILSIIHFTPFATITAVVVIATPLPKSYL
jgi:hypothetical protein